MPLEPGIASLDDLKSYLGKTGSSDDALLTSLLAAVSDRVEGYTGRLFRPDPPFDDQGHDTLDPVVKTVPLRRSGGWDSALQGQLAYQYVPPRTIDIPDAREITTITFLGAFVDSWEAIGDAPWRRIAMFGAPAWTVPQTALPVVQITGRFGIYPAPDDIKDAVLTIAARAFRERDAGYSDTVLLQDGATVSYFRQFPPRVLSTLDFYGNNAVRLA